MRSSLVVFLLVFLIFFVAVFSPPQSAKGEVVVQIVDSVVSAMEDALCDLNILWGCDGDGGPAAPTNACAPASDPPNYNGACNSPANACGTTNQGTIQCDGSCSTTAPANPANYGNVCNSPANACGATNQGTIQCNGSCGAQFAPPNPANYGNTCTGSANSCGLRNVGTISCAGACTATTPSESSCTNLNSCAAVTANPELTGPGGSSTLSWAATCGSGQACALYNTSDGVILATSTAGNKSVGPINVITKYALTCNVGSNVYSNTVIVSPSNARSGTYEEF